MNKELNVTNVTRFNIAEYKAFVEGLRPDLPPFLEASKKMGQLVLIHGRKLLVIDGGHVADLSVAPSDDIDEFIMEADVGNALLATERTFPEAMDALIKFANTYSTKFGVMHNMVMHIQAAGEAAFEGFSEEASMNDVAIYYANKLAFELNNVEDIITGEFMAHRYGFNVAQLDIVKEAMGASERMQ